MPDQIPQSSERPNMAFYGALLSEIKTRIRQAQTKAIFAANAEMIAMYWDIGRMICERQQMAGWSAAVIPNLSKDIKNELPEIKGFSERELETELVKHLEKFLLELGAGFAFVGRQYRVEISEKDFYVDLLFYHLKLRCFLVIDLKKGDFKPEYAGKMNFYCSVFDDLMKHPTDQSTIGLILCQSKDKILAEYALRDMNKPIGVSEYELTRALPEHLKSSLPSIEELEAELAKPEHKNTDKTNG